MENNFAFIDGQNLYLELKKENKKLDYKKFIIYLKEKFKVSKSYIFLGYIEKNKNIYTFLSSYGYCLIFKENILVYHNKIKANIDAELTLQIKLDFNKFDKAVIVSGDGDFYCWIKHLIENNKLKIVMSPRMESCSKSLKDITNGNVVFLNNKRFENKLFTKIKSAD